jgi:hypothetical protein
MTDRLEKLRSQYPEVTQSALMNMPSGFEADAVKVHSFAEAWETAEALGGMLKKHVLGLGRPESSAFGEITGPTIGELAHSHSEMFLNKVRAMRWDKGAIGKAEVAAAFMEQVERVVTLQKDMRAACRQDTQSRRLSR